MSRTMVAEIMAKVRIPKLMVAIRLLVLSMGYLLADAATFA